MTSMDEENSPLRSQEQGGDHSPEQHGVVVVYRRRWYILFVFCLLCLLCDAVWNSLSPITGALEAVYGWTDGNMALFINWAPIACVILLLPFPYILDKLGTRYTMLLFTFFMALGTALRTLSTSDPFFLLSCHAGLFLNALTTFIPLSFPPHIAALWFPEEERILATALPQACIMLGYGVASILGPIAVPFDHVERAENGTASLSLSQLEETKENIHRYMLWTAVLAAAYFLVVLAYFPDGPPTPPSPPHPHPPRRREEEGESGFGSVFQTWAPVFRDARLQAAALSFSFPAGIQFGYLGTLALQFQSLPADPSQVGAIGFASLCGQTVTILAAGLSMDRLRRYLKEVILALLATTVLGMIWLAAIVLRVVPYDFWQLGAATFLATVAFFTTMPLSYELCCMVAAPSGIPESQVGVYLTGALSLFMMVFLLVMMVPNLALGWVSYLMVASAALGLVLLIPVRVRTGYSQIP